jgi:hypothetical protein
MADGSPDISPPTTKVLVTDAFEVHRHMVIALFIAASFLCFLLVVGLLTLSVTVSMIVTAAGAMGGFVSALRRLYTFQRVFPVNFVKTHHKVDIYLFSTRWFHLSLALLQPSYFI